MIEEWRPVVGYEGYEVSNLGRVRSWLKPGRQWSGMVRQRRTVPRMLAPAKFRTGYLMYSLVGESAAKYLLASRLVAMTFIPNPEGLPQVNHKNGVKGDNRVENLEWISRSGNRQHAVDVLGLGRGERHGCARLTEDDVRQIRNMIREGMSNKKIASQFGVHPKHVWSIKVAKSWRYFQ